MYNLKQEMLKFVLKELLLNWVIYTIAENRLFLEQPRAGFLTVFEGKQLLNWPEKKPPKVFQRLHMSWDRFKNPDN